MADPGDRSVWASQVIESRRKRKKSTPKAVDLEAAITDIQITDLLRGSSTITLTLTDPNWTLTDGGFFDSDEDGRVDPIEVNYPLGSKYVWRLTSLDVDTDGRDAAVSMTFMERSAAILMAMHGPKKAGRSKMTRAEFINARVVEAKPKLTFHSRELHQKQPVAGEKAKPKKDAKKRKQDKSGGINGKETIRFSNWDGSNYTLQPNELRNAEVALDQAFQDTQDERAILAMLCACIVEGPMFRNPTGGDASSAGILQLLAAHGSLTFRRDIPNVVHLFMTRGFWGKGGAIALSRAHPNWTVGQIAQNVQGSAFPNRYDQVKDGAVKVLRAYGGTGGVTTTYRKEYHFQVGTPEAPREDYWTAFTRLADEVNWPLFVDGDDVYFDPETELIRQKPALVVKRGDPEVISFKSTWDGRHIATEATLELLIDPFLVRAGEVVKLENFGPASSGSTAKLPGRWLISEVGRGRFDLSSTLTLKQPEKPDPEPAPEVATRTRSGNFIEGSSTGGKKSDIYAACKSVSDENRAYSQATSRLISFTNSHKHVPLDCSNSVALALHRAGMYDDASAMVSGTFATSWGEPGQGDDFTVWANGAHVFLMSEVDDWRFDTSGGPPSGPHVRNAKRSTAGFTPRHWKGR